MTLDQVALSCPECGGTERLASCCEFWLPRLKRARRNRELRAEPVVLELEVDPGGDDMTAYLVMSQ